MTASVSSFCPVHVVYGPEAFLKQEAVRALIAAVLGEQTDTLGPSRFEGDRAELADVLDEVRTLSLLGEMRVVVVEEAS